METRYKGALKLSAIGDALGWITEFVKSQDSLKRKHKTSYISEFYEWPKKVGGKFNSYLDIVKEGSYSDDTQLLLSVARSIKIDGTVDREYFSKIELPSWLLYARGGGRTIKNAAKKIGRTNAKWYKNFFEYKVGDTKVDYRESGANGAAMRILPIVLANFGKIDKIKEEIFANSIVTHGHPRAIIGAILYGYAVNTILNLSPDEFKYEDFLTELGKDIHNKLSITPFIEKPDFCSWENEWNNPKTKKIAKKIPFREEYNKILDETQQYLRDIYRGLSMGIENEEQLKSLRCYEAEHKGSGISTVLAGIFLSCKYYKEPIKAIEQAANSIGTDTDSIAAFAGGLIGSLYGEAIIPEKFISIQDSAYLDKVALRLLAISENRGTEAELITLPQDQELKKQDLSELNSELDFKDLMKGERVFFQPLGVGRVVKIDEQDILKQEKKYYIIVDVEFEIGQSCRFARLFSLVDVEMKISYTDKDGESQTKEFTCTIKTWAGNLGKIFEIPSLDCIDIGGIQEEILVTAKANLSKTKLEYLARNVISQMFDANVEVVKEESKDADKSGQTEENGEGVEKEKSVTLRVYITGETSPVTQKKTGQAGN